MENLDNVDTSPATPRKRYSCASEYATPKESDDSDSSLYYSFIESLENCIDDDVVNKENSVNATLRTITDTLNSPTISRVSQAKTPLLRKVLQNNHTPCNKNKKRVSFSHLSKMIPTPTATVKVPKPKDSDTIKLHAEKELPVTSNEKQIEQKIEQKSENVEETNDESVSSDVTDDLENELHNTIIENPSPAANETLVLNSEQHVTSPNIPIASQSCTITIPIETNKLSESIELTNDLSSKNNTPQSNETTVTNVRTIEQIIKEARKNIPQTRNTKDNRKSILPINKKATRATTYKRRSSTYEPRKVDSRKTLGVLKQIAKKVGGKQYFLKTKPQSNHFYKNSK